MVASRFKPPWLRPPVRRPEQRLARKGIYILPTRNGLLLALLLVAMLIGAMNYGNSLAYGLVFLLASVAVISILHTYRNLAHLVVRSGQCQPVFAGDTALFPIGVENRGGPRYAVGFEQGNRRALTDLPATSLQWVTLRQETDSRGWCPLPRVTAATTFPLGLLRAWAYVDLDQRCLVYPCPEQGRGPLPLGTGEGGEEARGPGFEDFSALRDYRAGDSLRHIHWKAMAREQGLLTKEFEGSGGGDLTFDWDELAGLAPEARLARLCRWVLTAESEGYRYGLRLPGRHITPGRGPDQRHRCLEALALFGRESP